MEPRERPLRGLEGPGSCSAPTSGSGSRDGDTFGRDYAKLFGLVIEDHEAPPTVYRSQGGPGGRGSCRAARAPAHRSTGACARISSSRLHNAGAATSIPRSNENVTIEQTH